MTMYPILSRLCLDWKGTQPCRLKPGWERESVSISNLYQIIFDCFFIETCWKGFSIQIKWDLRYNLLKGCLLFRSTNIIFSIILLRIFGLLCVVFGRLFDPRNIIFWDFFRDELKWIIIRSESAFWLCAANKGLPTFPLRFHPIPIQINPQSLGDV